MKKNLDIANTASPLTLRYVDVPLYRALLTRVPHKLCKILFYLNDSKLSRFYIFISRIYDVSWNIMYPHTQLITGTTEPSPVSLKNA